MRNPKTWICPGCGRNVALPADCRAEGTRYDRRRLDQLAQALCGCWVSRLPNGGLARLLGAVMKGSETCQDDDLGFSRGDA